jgi:hypothetical protein
MSTRRQIFWLNVVAIAGILALFAKALIFG